MVASSIIAVLYSIEQVDAVIIRQRQRSRTNQRTHANVKAIKQVVTDEISENVDIDQKDAILAAATADAAAISQKMKDNSEGGDQASENVNSLIDSTQFDQFVDQVQDGDSDDSLFMLTYTHSSNNKDDDERYLRILFKKYAEQAWDEKGHQIEGKKALSKKGAKKFATEILSSWQKLSAEENESYIQQNFDQTWSKFDSSPSKDTGMLNMETATKFMMELN